MLTASGFENIMTFMSSNSLHKNSEMWDSFVEWLMFCCVHFTGVFLRGNNTNSISGFSHGVRRVFFFFC